MGRFYKYAIARFVTDTLRNESLNIGLIVFNELSVDVIVPKSIDKIKAISTTIDIDLVRESLFDLHGLDQCLISQGSTSPEGRLKDLSDISPIGFSSIGEFQAASVDTYNQTLRRLMTTLVEPEASTRRTSRNRPTKLLSDVKSAFKSERVMARKGEGLEAHRIVTRHRVAEGLEADLLLKNGAMHVVQTVDASSEEGSLRRMIGDIAISALVFEQARMSFGEDKTQSKLVYRASSSLEGSISPSLEAAEHQGARLVNWESRDDRTRFIVELSSLAEPTEGSQSKTLDNVHASTLPRRALN